MDIQLFPWQKEYLETLIQSDAKPYLCMPHRSGYTDLRFMALLAEVLLKGEKDMNESDYYWEKAEFQDPLSHRQHVENYKKGIRSSVAFDEQYAAEAAAEMEKGE